MGMFLGSFSKMGTIFSIHMKQLHADIMRDTLTGLTFQSHNQNILFVLPLWVYFWEGIFQLRGMFGIYGLCRYGYSLQTSNHTSG